jgi:hypothetical protein
VPTLYPFVGKYANSGPLRLSKDDASAEQKESRLDDERGLQASRVPGDYLILSGGSAKNPKANIGHANYAEHSKVLLPNRIDVTVLNTPRY